MKFLIVFAILIAFKVNAQNGASILSKDMNPPFKPIENNTRIVFTSEDTNMKRRPTHVSNQVSDQRINQKFLISKLILMKCQMFGIPSID